MNDFKNHLTNILQKTQMDFAIEPRFISREKMRELTRNSFEVRGVFNEQEIFIADNIGDEDKVYFLLHIVGHYLQWKESSADKEYSFFLQKSAESKDPLDMEKLHLHEAGSVKFSIEFLHQMDIFSLDTWFTDRFNTDQEHVDEYFGTDKSEGKIEPFNHDYIYLI